MSVRLRPWHCLMAAWIGMAMLWAGHQSVLAEGTSGSEVDAVEGVMERVHPMRAGGFTLRVLSADGRVESVWLEPALGLLPAVEAGRRVRVEGVWEGQGRTRHLVPMSALAVWIGEASEIMTVAAAREAKAGRSVWLRVRVKDLKRRAVSGGASSLRCVLVDDSGEIEATMARARESDLALLDGEVVIYGRARSYYHRPAVRIGAVSPP